MSAEGAVNETRRRVWGDMTGVLRMSEPIEDEAAYRWLIAHIDDCPNCGSGRTGLSAVECPEANAYFDEPPAVRGAVSEAGR